VSNKKGVCFERLEEENGNDERVEENDGMKNQVPIDVESLISINGEMDEDFVRNVRKQGELKF
jgi:hypothetical protein